MRAENMQRPWEGQLQIPKLKRNAGSRAKNMRCPWDGSSTGAMGTARLVKVSRAEGSAVTQPAEEVQAKCTPFHQRPERPEEYTGEGCTSYTRSPWLH